MWTATCSISGSATLLETVPIVAYQEPSLTFLNNRHYDPTTGTFVSVDPLVTMTGQPYIYGAANPITYSDPDGLDPDTASWIRHRAEDEAGDHPSPEGPGPKSHNNGCTYSNLTSPACDSGRYPETVPPRLPCVGEIVCPYNCGESEQNGAFLLETSWVRCAQDWRCGLPTAVAAILGLAITGLVCTTVPLTFGASAGLCAAAGVGSSVAINTVKNATLGDPPLDNICSAAVGGANPVAEGSKRLAAAAVTRAAATQVCS